MMKVNFNVKYKFKVNGKEYGSPEEMPAEIREAYEKAVGNRTEPEHINIQSISAGKIVFNGQEYESADSMPPGIRRMYETIMVSVKSGQISTDGNAARTGGEPFSLKNAETAVFQDAAKPVSPESFLSPRIFILAAAVIALLAGIYFLFGGK